VNYDSVSGISDRQVEEEYEASDLVVFVSRHEGFGLPIIEAQAMGRPVVTSNREPMKWVAGDGAEFVDPDDPADIRRGIRLALSDGSVRTRLIARGLANTQRFSVENAARGYLHIYRAASPVETPR
jgi:glycosyltransferase involved in cell wall biosynthesis